MSVPNWVRLRSRGDMEACQHEKNHTLSTRHDVTPPLSSYSAHLASHRDPHEHIRAAPTPPEAAPAGAQLARGPPPTGAPLGRCARHLTARRHCVARDASKWDKFVGNRYIGAAGASRRRASAIAPCDAAAARAQPAYMRPTVPRSSVSEWQAVRRLHVRANERGRRAAGGQTVQE